MGLRLYTLGAVYGFFLLLDITSLSLECQTQVPEMKQAIRPHFLQSLSLSARCWSVWLQKKKKILIVSSVVTTSCGSSWTACAVVISQMAESHLLLSTMCISECVKTRHSTQLREGAVRCHSGQAQGPHHPLVD